MTYVITMNNGQTWEDTSDKPDIVAAVREILKRRYGGEPLICKILAVN